MKKINIPNVYSYFFDILRCMYEKKHLPTDEINIVGGRKSGKTTAVQLFFSLICMLGLNYVGLIAFRATIDDSKQLLDDFKNTYDAYSLNYKTNVSRSTINMNKCDIRISGLNSMSKGNVAKKSGLAKFGNVKYIVIFFEERFEFQEKDVLAIKEAVRSIDPTIKNVEYLMIQVCNPWAKSSPYISYLGKYQTWDINKLKTTGSQIGLYNIPVGDGKVKRTIIHYTNWRAIKEYLSESDIKGILDTWNQDPKRAPTTDFGLPGYETGAIYTDLMSNLGKAIYQEHEYLCGGMDYGWGRESNSGKTVCYFLGYSEGNGIDIYDEYVHSNSECAKSPDLVAQEVCLFYRNAMFRYIEAVGWNSPFNITVRVDNMAIGMIQILNSTAQRYNMSWLRFTKCKKYAVADRIEITRSTMYQHKLRLSDNVKLLKQEMEMAYYEPDAKDANKRVKANDHGINAFEYGIESFFFKLARDNGITNISIKDKRNKIW